MKTKILSSMAICLGLLLCVPQMARAVTADVDIHLKLECSGGKNCSSLIEESGRFVSGVSLNKGEEFTVDVMVKNPSGQSIISVQSWLNYDPAKLEGVSVDTFSNFGLVAPGEKEFDAPNKRVKIGVASTSGGDSSAEFKVASVRFRVIANGTSTSDLSFYDYQVSELGKTNVNVIEDGFPVNVIASPPKALRLSLNKDGLPADIGGPPGNEIPVIAFDIPRPTGLKVTTGNRYAYLVWDQVPGYAYKIYYGNQQGFYLHQKDVGQTNSFYVTNLENNETHFFAIKAYNPQNVNSMSDYSDEVAVIINHPETSTSPLYLDGDFSQTKTGPATSILVALFSGAVGWVFTRRKSFA